jgi:hypothetical protein
MCDLCLLHVNIFIIVVFLFWGVIPRRLNFMCRRFGTFCLFHLLLLLLIVEWGRIRGPAAPMHLGRTNGPFVHRF